MSNLVVTRRVGERILIGDDIAVTVTAINHNQVKIAVSAPKHVSVDREEIRDRKNAGKQR